uniref:WD repeat-containing protein 53-like protein n=1 Tax=Callorhinchus milii TaxID=7868 RepID=V9L070_CALMI
MATKWTGGHSTGVLCLDANCEGLVVSGAEEGNLVTWSSEGCPVSSLKLGADDITYVSFSRTDSNTLYTSHGEAISILDIRCLKEATECFKVNEDEINCLSVNETSSHLAAADDSGSIKIIDLANRKVSRTLRKHSNICSCVTFRPQRPHSLLSCGLDMQVMLWNLQKTRPVWTVNFQELTEEEEEEEEMQQQAGCQLFNPPLVHFTSVASCGNVFACGAEDGKIRIFRITGTRFELEHGFSGHSLGTSQVHFLNLSHPYWLLSGGNDGKVALWDVGERILKDNRSPSKTTPRKKTKASSPAKKGLATKECNLSAQTCKENKSNHPLAKLSIDHGAKVNWLSSAEIKGRKTILVADHTGCISLYPLTNL